MRPTYTAVYTRSGEWWAITVPEVPGVFSQARTISEVEPMASEAIALMLDVPKDGFEVEVRPEAR